MLKNRLRSEREDHRHFEAALELRHAIYCNAQDEAFVAERRDLQQSIVYLMDANIVRKFMNPWRESRDLIPFSDESSLQDDEAVATAVIAAEFLFSRKLPGQYGQPALIAPGHADELSGFVSRLHELQHEEGSSVRSRGAPTLKPLRERLAAWSRASKPHPSDVERDLRETFATTILDSLFGEAAQLVWLLRADRLRSLRTHFGASPSILSLADHEDLVAALSEEIAGQRREYGSEHGTETIAGRPPSKPHSTASQAQLPQTAPQQSVVNSLRNRNDAAAIVQTILLNQTARNRDHCRHVLVSGDGAVHRAYARWFSSTKNNAQAPEDYILRSPIQYIALLNRSSISSMRRPTLLTDVQFALDMLLRPLWRTERAHPSALALIAAHEYSQRTGVGEPLGRARDWRASPVHYDRDALQDVRDAFREANTECLRQDQEFLLPLLRRRFHGEADVVSEGLRRWGADPDGAIRRYQEELILKIEAAHLSMGVGSTLLDVWQQTAGPRERAPMSLRVDFSDIAGGSVEGDGLGKFVADPERWRQTAERLKQPGSAKAVLFGAYVALRCARWPAARLYAERALAFIEREPCEADELRLEVRHCIAVSRRFDMNSRVDFDEVYQLLTDEIATYRIRGDHFGILRGESEQFLLRLTLAFRLAVNPDSDFRGDDADLSYDVSSALLQLDTVGHAPDYRPGGRWHGPFNRVELQMAVNVMLFEILRGIFERQLPESDLAMLRHCDGIVARGVATGSFPRVLEADFLAFRWLTERQSQSRHNQLGIELDQLCDDLLRQEATAEPTPLDRDALKRYKLAVKTKPFLRR